MVDIPWLLADPAHAAFFVGSALSSSLILGTALRWLRLVRARKVRL